MELLVETEVLLMDKLVMGGEWEDGSVENLQTVPGLFLQIREGKSCWERISEVREVERAEIFQKGITSTRYTQKRPRGWLLPEQVTLGRSKVEARDRHWRHRRKEAVGKDGQ